MLLHVQLRGHYKALAVRPMYKASLPLLLHIAFGVTPTLQYGGVAPNGEILLVGIIWGYIVPSESVLIYPMVSNINIIAFGL